MRRRRKALAAVQDRLDKFVVDEDTSALLTQEASREAGDLAAMTDPGKRPCRSLGARDVPLVQIPVATCRRRPGRLGRRYPIPRPGLPGRT